MDEMMFIEALRENPLDHVTRYVYADWLDEHGYTDKAEEMRYAAKIVQIPAYQHVNPDLWLKDYYVLHHPISNARWVLNYKGISYIGKYKPPPHGTFYSPEYFVQKGFWKRVN